MRNEKCLFAFLSIVLYLIARLSQKRVFMSLPTVNTLFLSGFYLWFSEKCPMTSAAACAMNNAYCGYPVIHETQKPPAQLSRRLLSFFEYSDAGAFNVFFKLVGGFCTGAAVVVGVFHVNGIQAVFICMADFNPCPIRHCRLIQRSIYTKFTCIS